MTKTTLALLGVEVDPEYVFIATWLVFGVILTLVEN